MQILEVLERYYRTLFAFTGTDMWERVILDLLRYTEAEYLISECNVTTTCDIRTARGLVSWR
jgi:hypothetical protein